MRKVTGACLLVALAWCACLATAQAGVPMFTRTLDGHAYTFAGRDPAQPGTAVIPTVLVSIRLAFADGADTLDAAPYVPRILASPVFVDYPFAGGEPTQYGDALLRATFPRVNPGRTILGAPQVKSITIPIPAAYGYVLHSRHGGRSFAVVDSEYVEAQLFKQIPKEPGRLVIAVVLNAAFYAAGDATVCCGWGTHGVDPATGNAFVLASYLHQPPAIVTERDIQPLTQQLAEFYYDPLHDPRAYFYRPGSSGNHFRAWRRPGEPRSCGGRGVGSNYFLLEPTDTDLKNDFPASTAYVVHATGFDYHLQNVALLGWYRGDRARVDTYSFPDPRVLPQPSAPCRSRSRHAPGKTAAAVVPVKPGPAKNGHWLIGYWTGARLADGRPFLIRDVAPQWDVVLVAFAPPARDRPQGTMSYAPPKGITPAELERGIAELKARGTKVMLSLGGGGRYFKLDHASDIPNFVSSVAGIVKQYGFDGIDLDFESPSLELIPGDTDFRHPVTPSVVNLIAALRQLRAKFGAGFMLSLVPEGTQISGGMVSYGGQFGSELPIAYALRNDWSFVDVQEYNTPPLEGLDGSIYQVHTVDYAVAMTELLLRGFDVARNPRMFFPPFPADKIAVGFLVGYDPPELASQVMRYLITGQAPAGSSYALRARGGYPAMLGAMFWTVDADRWQDYRYSNLIGAELRAYPKAR